MIDLFLDYLRTELEVAGTKKEEILQIQNEFLRVDKNPFDYFHYSEEVEKINFLDKTYLIRKEGDTISVNEQPIIIDNKLGLGHVIAKYLAIYYASIFNFEGEYNYFWDYNCSPEMLDNEDYEIYKQIKKIVKDIAFIEVRYSDFYERIKFIITFLNKVPEDKVRKINRILGNKYFLIIQEVNNK